MRFVRVWLPVAIVAAGLIAIVATGGSLSGVEGGVAIMAAGISVWMLNVIFRVGVAGERERDAEDAARDFYAEHGYWPDEAPPAAAEPAPPPAVDPHRRAPPADHPHRPAGRPTGPARRPPRRP
jgi:hypothetical protein